MTEAERKLIEAALHYRRSNGPATVMNYGTMELDIAQLAEDVIRERNRAFNEGRDFTPTVNRQ